MTRPVDIPGSGGCLLLTPDYPPSVGGIQTLCQSLAQRIRTLDVVVVTDGRVNAPTPNDPPVVSSWLAARARPEALRHVVGNVFGFVQIYHRRPAVVICMHTVLSLACAVAARLLRIPYIQYIHAEEVTRRPAVARFALRNAVAVIAVSSFSGGLARRHGAAKQKIHIITNGVRPPMTEPATKLARPTLVTVSRMTHWYKGHDIIVKALPLIVARVPMVEWLCIGDGPLRPHYEAAVRDAGLAGHVRFLGNVSDDERDAWVAGAHAFLLPSRVGPDGSEGFGIAYLEASALGTPPVGGNVGGGVDAICDGVSGLSVNPEDERAVADAAIAILTDSDLRERLRAGGLMWSRAHSWEAVTTQVEQVLVEALRPGR